MSTASYGPDAAMCIPPGAKPSLGLSLSGNLLGFDLNQAAGAVVFSRCTIRVDCIHVDGPDPLAGSPSRRYSARP